MARFSPSTEPHRLFIDRYFEELLARGIQYFLPSSELTTVGRSEEGKPELGAHFRDAVTDLEWLGTKYSLINQGKNFSEHEQKLLKGIGKVLSTRYQLLFNADVVASSEIFNGLPEDHYVSAFLDPYVFAGAATLSKITDRVSEAIEVLRISALSTYEDRRISTGALLFGFQPDACHALPSHPAEALPYSSELTSIRSFHRICDGLRTVALVDRQGLMVELVDVAEWAHPYAEFELPVPSARRYEAHHRATLCGGHVCLVLTPNGDQDFCGWCAGFQFPGRPLALDRRCREVSRLGRVGGEQGIGAPVVFGRAQSRGGAAWRIVRHPRRSAESARITEQSGPASSATKIGENRIKEPASLSVCAVNE